MKSFIGVKILQAKSMNLGDYNRLKGWTIPDDENPLSEGYVVYYPDNYVSWSPKAAFENAYREITEGERKLAVKL